MPGRAMGGLVDERESTAPDGGGQPSGAVPWYLQQGDSSPAVARATPPAPVAADPPLAEQPVAVELPPPADAVAPPAGVPPQPWEATSPARVPEHPARAPWTPAEPAVEPPAARFLTQPETPVQAEVPYSFQQVVDAERAAAGLPPRAPRDLRPALIAALVVAVLALGGVGWLILRPAEGGTDAVGTSQDVAATSQDTSDGGSPTTQQSAPSTQSSAPTPTPTASPEEAALDSLVSLRNRSLQGLALDGRWVPQVASKSVGITDPMQIAQNGTNTFYAADILAESLAAQMVAPASTVLVLQSTDFGKFSTAADGQPYWVTLVDLGFGSSDAVDGWCATAFANLAPDARENACAPRTLTPSYQ